MHNKTSITGVVTLEEGQSKRTTCPFCGRKDTFSVTHLGDKVLYNCYSIFCTNSTGVINIKEGSEYKASRLRQRIERVEVGEGIMHIPNHWGSGLANSVARAYAERTHQMQAIEAGIFVPYYDTLHNRYIYPIRNGVGHVVGAVGRNMLASGSKSINHGDVNSFPFVCGKGSSVILVEDCASAVAATRIPGLVGVSLLGTFLRESYITHLSNYKRVYVALDADARLKGLDICKKLKVYLDDVVFIPLDKDIKDMDNSELMERVACYMES